MAKITAVGTTCNFGGRQFLRFPMLQFSHFKKFSQLVYGFSEKQDGPIQIVPDAAAEESRNEKSYLSKFGISASGTVKPSLDQGSSAVFASSVNKGRRIGNSDALVSADKNLFLIATGADCFPVYFFDPKNNIVGLAHAGWRGIVGGIVPNTIGLIIKEGSDPRNLLVGIGPGIQKHHFEIKNNVLERFAGFERFIERADGKIFVDLPGIIHQQLQQRGIQRRNIEQSGECTYCLSDKYFSFRRDKPERVQSMLALIGIRD